MRRQIIIVCNWLLLGIYCYYGICRARYLRDMTRVRPPSATRHELLDNFAFFSIKLAIYAASIRTFFLSLQFRSCSERVHLVIIFIREPVPRPMVTPSILTYSICVWCSMHSVDRIAKCMAEKSIDRLIATCHTLRPLHWLWHPLALPSCRVQPSPIFRWELKIEHYTIVFGLLQVYWLFFIDWINVLDIEMHLTDKNKTNCTRASIVATW